MSGFGPCTLKKNIKIFLLQVATSVFTMQVAITLFSKVNIQVDLNFNGLVTPYIESMLLYW
jgi:hypothetical protein